MALWGKVANGESVAICATWDELAKAMLAVVAEVDYDISKEYDPEYEGREDPEARNLDDLVGTLLNALDSE